MSNSKTLRPTTYNNKETEVKKRFQEELNARQLIGSGTVEIVEVNPRDFHTVYVEMTDLVDITTPQITDVLKATFKPYEIEKFQVILIILPVKRIMHMRKTFVKK